MQIPRTLPRDAPEVDTLDYPGENLLSKQKCSRYSYILYYLIGGIHVAITHMIETLFHFIIAALELWF